MSAAWFQLVQNETLKIKHWDIGGPDKRETGIEPTLIFQTKFSLVKPMIEMGYDRNMTEILVQIK